MTKSLIARAACGAVLAIAIACGDSPTSASSASERAVAPTANTLAGFSLTPNFFAGERALHRSIVLPDGRQFTVDGVRGADGLPRDLQISQEGVIVARLRNEWRVTGTKAVLQRQQMVRYSNGEVVGAFDTNANGGVESIAGHPITMPTASAIDASGVSGVARKTTTFSDFDDYWGGGPCDAQARAVEAALDNWLYSNLGMVVGTATGNAIAAYSAWAYQLKCWRDVVRAEAALDQCVADAGKAPEW